MVEPKLSLRVLFDEKKSEKWMKTFLASSDLYSPKKPEISKDHGFTGVQDAR